MTTPLLVISLDFELAWGMGATKAYGSYRGNILGARQAVPRILDLAERYGIGCTWATVGLLFFDEKEEMLECLPEVRPEYRNATLSAYARMDRVGRNEREDPLHFGLSLIRQIQACPRQELAGHTFSHYYCLEDGGNAAAFAADLAAAARAARHRGADLKSLVFPRNQVRPEYLGLCVAAGYRAFRGTQDDELHRSRPRDNESTWLRLARTVDCYQPFLRAHRPVRPATAGEMVDIPASRFLRPAVASAPILNYLGLKRIEDEMTAAAQTGSVYHLWWHPHNFGRNTDLNLLGLRTIFDHYAMLSREYGMIASTMRDVAGRTACAGTVKAVRTGREWPARGTASYG